MGASKAELWTQLLQIIKMLDEHYAFGATNTTNFLDEEDTLKNAYAGNHVGATQQLISNWRTNLSNQLANAPAVLTPVLLELAKIGYNSISGDVLQAKFGTINNTRSARTLIGLEIISLIFHSPPGS